MVADDSSVVSRCERLELLNRRCDADGATARVGSSRCPANDRYADNQLCGDTVTVNVMRFHRRAMISRHVGGLTDVAPWTDAVVIYCGSSKTTLY